MISYVSTLTAASAANFLDLVFSSALCPDVRVIHVSNTMTLEVSHPPIAALEKSFITINLPKRLARQYPCMLIDSKRPILASPSHVP